MNLKHILDALPEGVGVLSREGKLVYRNSALRRMLEPESERRSEVVRLVRRTFRGVISGLDTRSARAGHYIANAIPMATASDPEARQHVLVRVRTIGHGNPPHAGNIYGFQLTPREAQVAALLARGASNATIARTLRISPFTARRHTERVLAKLGAESRGEAGAVIAAIAAPHH